MVAINGKAKKAKAAKETTKEVRDLIKAKRQLVKAPGTDHLVVKVILVVNKLADLAVSKRDHNQEVSPNLFTNKEGRLEAVVTDQEVVVRDNPIRDKDAMGAEIEGTIGVTREVSNNRHKHPNKVT